MRRLSLVLLAACNATVGGSTARPDAAAAGGDAAVQSTDGARSGDRLKIVWYQFNDGTRTYDGTLYDVERKENCFIYEGWTDGKTYCAPAKANSNVVFTDAACSKKVVQVQVDPNCPAAPPPSIVDFDYTACTAQPARAYQRGAQQTVSQYYVNYGYGCEGPYADGGGYDYYALGTLITNLAEVSLDTPTGNGRVTSRFYTSNRRPAVAGAHARPASSISTASPATSARARPRVDPCSPYDAGFFDYFHDAQCTQSVLDLPNGCAAPDVAVRYDTSCPNDPGHYFRVGAQTTASTLYTGSPGSCTSTSAPTGETFFSAGGDELGVAPLSRAPDSTGHRIELIHETTPDGLVFRDGALYDSLSGSECYPTTMPDGTQLCFPSAYGTETMYTDNKCTNGIDVVEVYTGDPTTCGQTPPPVFGEKYIAPVPGACNPTYELHKVGGVHAGTLYANFGSCAVYAPGDTVIYDVGDVAPYSGLAAATRTTDD